MRISDWSSDVCSSDLEIGRELIDQARRKSKCDQVGAASLAQVEAGGDRHPASAHLGIGNVAVELAAPFASGQKAVINAVRHVISFDVWAFRLQRDLDRKRVV